MTSDGGPATGAAGAGAGAAGRLLGHRSLLLHWEVKRHQAWWKKVLDRGLLTRLAEHASSKALLARTAAEHSHVALLKRAGDVLCERTKKRAGGGKLSSLVDRAAQAAGGSVQDQELAAILCGCCDGWRTDVLFTPLAVEDGHRSQRAPGAEGALASVVHADARWDALDLEVTRLSNRRGLGSSGTAYQVRKKAGAFTEAVGHTRRVGGKVVVHPDVEGGEPPVRLVDEIRRARQWHDRHSACFIPLAWAVSAAFAAKWECSGGDADSVTRGEDSDNSGSRGGRGKGKKKGGSGGKASVRRPSPSSVLALVAAFLDKESTAKGFISGSLKAMFGGGPRVSFGKINPNLGELLLLFMSFLKGLGTTQHTVGALELSGDGTVSQQQPSAAEKRASQGDVRDRAIRLSVDGRAVQDITDVRVVSLLRRTCDSVQLALTPNAACGLPVWGNDPRWSLLGHVLGSSAETGGVIEEVVDRGVPAASRCYLTWMDDLLEMCEEHDEGGMCTGLPGFTLTGSTTKQSSKAAAQLSKRHSADIRKARLADAAFVAATTPGGSLAAQGTAGRGWVGAAVNAFGQQHAGENAGGGDDDDNDATMSVVDGDADKISTLSSSLYEGSDIDGEEMDENNPLLRQPRPTAGDILEGGSEGDGAGAASSPAQSTTGDGATVAMRSRMGTSVSRSGGGWETVAEGVESVVEASDKMEDVLARGERVLQEAARMVAAAKAASGVASSKGRGVRDVAPGVGGKSAATEASGQPGKECASSSTGVPADPLSKQIDDVNPSTRGRVMQGEEQGKQMTADDAAVSATPRSREVTERERARALAKERGRERGKQRQQQCEKERLLKLKELVRKRERKLETEAREKRRQEEEWEAEALRAERRKTRLERWERGTERRTVGIKEEMGKSVLREADEVDDNGNRDGDLKQKGTDSSGSSSSSSDSSSDRSESHSQTQSRDCRSGSSNGASVRGERRGRNGTDSSDNRVSSSTASRSPRAARVLGSSRDGSSCVAEGISVNRRGESGTRAEYIAVSNLSGDGVKASGDAEQGHGESKWSPWRSVSSSNDSEDADDVVKGAMLTPAVDKGNEELAETTDAHTFRAHRSSSGSVDGSDVAHRRLGRSVDGSLDWRYVQTNSQYNTRSRANSVESNDVDWRIRSRKRQVIVDVGGAAGRGSNRTHRPVSGDHRVITEREMEESRPQSKRRARNSRSISNSTERRPRRLSRSRERQRDPSQSRERRYVQERGQFGRNADDRRPGWSPVGDRRHRNARSERSRDRSRSIERGRARSPSSHNLQSGARPLRSGSNEANHSRSLITQRRAHDCRSRSREGRSRDDDRPGGSRSRNNSRPRQSRSQESRSPQEELPTTTAGMLEAGAQGTMMGSAISVGSVRQAGNVKSIGPGRKGMMASSASTAAAACAAISAKVSAQGGADIAYNPTAVANAVHGTGWPVIHLQIPATTSLDQAGTASPTTAAVQTLAEEGCADSGHSTGRDGVRSGVKGTFAAVPTSMKRDVNWSGVVDLPHSSTWKSLGKSSPHDSPWRPNPLPETEQTAQGQPSLPLPLPLPLPPPPPSRLRPSFDTQMEGLAQRSAAAVAEVEGGGAAAQDDRSAVRRGPAFPDAMHTESLSGLAGDGAEPYLLTDHGEGVVAPHPEDTEASGDGIVSAPDDAVWAAARDYKENRRTTFELLHWMVTNISRQDLAMRAKDHVRKIKLLVGLGSPKANRLDRLLRGEVFVLPINTWLPAVADAGTVRDMRGLTAEVVKLKDRLTNTSNKKVGVTAIFKQMVACTGDRGLLDKLWPHLVENVSQERVKALAILREHLREADAKQSGLANLVKAVKSKQPYVASPPRPRPRPSPPPLPVPLPLPPPLPSAWPSETQNVGVQVAAIGSAPELSKAAKRAAKRRTQFGSIMMQLQTWFGLAWTVAEMMRLVALPVSSPEDPGGSMGHMVKGAIQGTNGDVEVEARIARQRREFVDALLGASSLAMSVAHIVGILKASSEQVVNSLLKNVPNEYQAHLLDVFACEVSMAATMLGVVMQRHVIAAKLGEELRAVVAEARTLYVPSHLEWNRSQQEVSNRLLGAGGAIKAVLNLCVKVAAEADPKTVKASRKSKRTAVMRGEAAGRSSSALKTEHVSQRLQSLTKPIANALQLAAAVSRTPLASLGDFSGKPDSVENLTPESEWRRSHGGPMALAYAEQAKCVAAVVEHRVGALAASINDVVRAIKEEWNPHDVRSAMLRARRKACTAFELLQAVRRGVAVGDRDTIAAAEAEGAALPAPPSCVWGLELLVERVHVVSRYAELTLRIYVTAGGARSSIMNACTSFSPSPSRELTLMKEARRLIAATLTLAVAIVEHVSAWANFTSGAVAIRNARMGAVAALVTHLLQDLDSSMALLEVIPVEQKPYHQAICDRIRCEARTVCVMLASVNEGIATDSKEALAAAVREGWLVTAESDHQTSRLHSTIKNTVQATEEVLKRVAVDATGGSPSSVATREVLHLTGNFLAQQKLLSVKATVVQCFLKQVNAQVAALQSSVQMQSAHQVIKKHYDAARGILGSAQVALGCFTGSNPRVNPTMEIRILLAGHAMTLKSEQEAHWDPQQLARELRDTCVAAENSFQKFKNSRSKKVKNNKELSFAIAATVATRELVNALGRLY